MIDPRERFSAAADLYHRYRPTYPAAVLEWIDEATGLRPPARIADVGCGTGISTRLLAERGFEVTGIDPNEAMLAHARGAGGLGGAPFGTPQLDERARIHSARAKGGRYRQGTATESGLPDGSVGLVTVAQAFHWFDVPAALAEFTRILARPGWCAAFWNLRRSSPFMDDYDALLRAQSSEYEVLLKPEATIQSIVGAKGVAAVRQGEFPNRQPLDRDGLFGRAYSSSYVIHGVADPEGFNRALGEVFDRHQSGGTVEFLYRTVAVCFRLR